MFGQVAGVARPECARVDDGVEQTDVLTGVTVLAGVTADEVTGT